MASRARLLTLAPDWLWGGYRRWRLTQPRAAIPSVLCGLVLCAVPGHPGGNKWISAWQRSWAGMEGPKPIDIRWARRLLLFRQRFYRVPGFFVSHLRRCVSFLRLFESRCRVLVASLVRTLAAMLRSSTMALGCLLVLVSGGSVCFHYVVFFVHDKYSFSRSPATRDRR